MKVTYVEFRAQSANGAEAPSNRMDDYSDGGLFHSEAMTWWADNTNHCWGYTLAVPTWHGNWAYPSVFIFLM